VFYFEVEVPVDFLATVWFSLPSEGCYLEFTQTKLGTYNHSYSFHNATVRMHRRRLLQQAVVPVILLACLDLRFSLSLASIVCAGREWFFGCECMYFTFTYVISFILCYPVAFVDLESVTISSNKEPPINCYVYCRIASLYPSPPRMSSPNSSKLVITRLKSFMFNG
jgi:hypothetical protein